MIQDFAQQAKREIRKENCLNCRFSEKPQDFQEALNNPHQKVCHFGPPNVSILQQGMVTGFPRVTKKDYCHQHKPALVLAGSQDI